MIDLANLEAKARAATQGEWDLRHDYEIWQDEPEGLGWHLGEAASYENAAYIAAAQPSVVLELIERIRAAEAKAGEPVAWQSKLTGAVTTTPSAYDFWREDIGAENITPLYAAPVDTAALTERVKTLEEALRIALPYVEAQVNDDGGIDNCEISDRLAYERARKALGGSNE